MAMVATAPTLHLPSSPRPAPQHDDATSLNNSTYYAIRKSKTVQHCIFFFWKDVQEHIENCDDAEDVDYKIFAALDDAANYALGNESHQWNNNMKSSKKNKAKRRKKQDLNASIVSPIVEEEKENDKNDGQDDGQILASEENNEEAVSGDNSNDSLEMSDTDDADNADDVDMDDDASETDSLPLSALKTNRELDVTAEEPLNDTEQQQQQSGDEHHEEPTSSSSQKRKRRRIKSSTSASSTSNDKPEILEIDGKIMQKRKPSKAWLIMYQRLKLYHFKTGSFHITVTKDTNNNNNNTSNDNATTNSADEKSDEQQSNNNDNAALKRWITDQRHQYKNFKLGRKHFISQEKIRLLNAIGFEFQFHSWDGRIEQLKRFQEIHGTCDVPPDNHLLGKWMESQKRQLSLFRKGKASKLTQVQVNQLRDLGMNVDTMEPRTSRRPETEEQLKKWEVMFDKLKEYKELTGNCNVSKSEENHDLYKWICAQRLEYKKLKEGHQCHMSATRLQQLNDIGFSFNPRSRYLKWEERMDQLRKFKEEHGHLRVPVTDPDLGEFVARQRVAYAKYVDGQPDASMTDERIRELTEMGFVFQAGKRRTTDQRAPRKTWDERFEELLQFKQIYRHTLVPQSSVGLGEWVHKQRKNYKKLKAGKPSPLTTERALKLADAGFVFDASGYRRGRKTAYDPPAIALPPPDPIPIPDPYRATIGLEG